MPFTTPSRTGSRPGPHRRSLLAAATGAALLTGCSDSGSDTAGKRPKAAAQARVRAARESAGLVEHYDAVIAAYPALADRLRPLRTEAGRHLDAFGGPPKPSASPSASASPDAPVHVPASEKEALASLAAAERRLADARRKALLDAPAEQARLLASVAAAGDAHAYLLGEAGR